MALVDEPSPAGRGDGWRRSLARQGRVAAWRAGQSARALARRIADLLKAIVRGALLLVAAVAALWAVHQLVWVLLGVDLLVPVSEWLRDALERAKEGPPSYG